MIIMKKKIEKKKSLNFLNFELKTCVEHHDNVMNWLIDNGVSRQQIGSRGDALQVVASTKMVEVNRF